MSKIESYQLDLAFPMNAEDVFHFDDSRPHFDGLCRKNGITYWFARDFMQMIGYQTFANFQKAMQKAISSCTTLGIDILENFQQVDREIDGKIERDYKLSRFACYLTAMNGDSKKPEVARAQAYFAAIAETFKRYIDQTEDVERVLIRDELSVHEKSLSGVAMRAGVTEYQYFQNAGYRGLYNMNMSDLKNRKGLVGKDSSRSLLDFMGKQELAANLFRVTQTEAKMKNEGIRGQTNAERAAEAVGRKVRQTMMEISGDTPESLPLSRDLKQVKGDLKASSKDFKRLDK
ncbi:damage-inducible protein D [Pseudomonas sp. 10B1]|uniref:BRO family protein n=1 Tax=unclassified Pseudomonas TaxID=196821 RepID=UPI002B238FB2|nr:MULTISPECIES: BRO family protein [unclassified Pseudomonas]MEA9997035.1 damage-inducible protein D [Pseudomonas sp. AA4]MEB0089225.1 damage-inducible protein D [Pseudomonas sp. RTI1]MEB0128417.1 damage-inducible protein D [Pseudomonas sp. CCC1.2]MEB0155315.1 damage-inducible protein D [Pseudomonas sp. CCC4.3]MEB0221683.1 damage-inducible protein D [Pseudomonas sp. AB12(2023)]